MDLSGPCAKHASASRRRASRVPALPSGDRPTASPRDEAAAAADANGSTKRTAERTPNENLA